MNLLDDFFNLSKSKIACIWIQLRNRIDCFQQSQSILSCFEQVPPHLKIAKDVSKPLFKRGNIK